MADLAVLSHDYMTVPEKAIKDFTAVITVVGVKIVHADAEFKSHDMPLPPVIASTSMASGCRHDHVRVLDDKLSCWLGLSGQQGQQERPSFNHPWATGCGCFAH